MVARGFAGIPRHAVGVEHHDHHALPKALVVAQQVQKLLAGRVQVVRRHPFELVPGENDIVAIHQQILGTGGRRVRGGRRRLRTGGLPRAELPPFHRAVSPLENCHQLCVLLRGAGIGGAGAGDRPLRLTGLHPRGRGGVQIAPHLVPRDREPRSVGAKDRIRRIVRVPPPVVTHRRGGRRLIGAGLVAPQRTAQAALPVGVGRHLRGVISQPRRRAAAGQHGLLPRRLAGVRLAAHALQIGHRPAEAARWQLQMEVIPRFQQHVFRPGKALPHRTAGGLPKVAALGVLFMRNCL